MLPDRMIMSTDRLEANLQKSKGYCIDCGKLIRINKGWQGRCQACSYKAQRPQTQAEWQAIILKRSEAITETGCWIWMGGVNEQGYGRLSIRNRIYAHRLSYEAFVGSVEGDLCVLHRCDVPSCVNPAHLFLGDRKMNLQDMWAKGRGNPPVHRGEDHGGAILTEQQVISIRKDDSPLQALAKRYGVCTATISNAKRGRSWRHIP